jgi:hypothetical protein
MRTHPCVVSAICSVWQNTRVRAKALEPFVKKAKTVVPLNPAVTPLVASFAEPREKNSRWKLMINESVEVDS